MRAAVRGSVLLLLMALLATVAGSVRADEDCPGEDAPDEKPAEEVDEKEREAVLARATSLNRRVVHLWQQRKYGDALPLAREALALRESVLEADHPDVALSAFNLGVQLLALGRCGEALPFYERALAIREKALGPYHPDVGTTANGLGWVHYSLGQFKPALKFLEQALEIEKKVSGPEHENVAPLMQRVAYVHRAEGRYRQARLLLEHSVAILERRFGRDHVYVTPSLNALGTVLRDTGDFEQARSLFERALSIREKAFGPVHPSVANSLNDLALLLQDTGQPEQARPLLRRAVEIYIRVHGPEHRAVATAMNNLAALHWESGELEEAGPLFEQALEIWAKVLGPEHPRIAKGLNNLALLLLDGGHVERARPLLERAIRIQEKVLGPDHTTLANTLTSLAGLHQRTGRYEEARPLYERALAIRERALGPEHPEVADALHRVSTICGLLGQHERSGPLLTRCLDIAELNVRRYAGGIPAAERVALAQGVRHHLVGWLNVCPRLGLSGYDEILRFKGIVARVTAAERRLARTGGAEAAQRVSALRAAEGRLATIAHSMPPRFQKKEHAAWREAYATAGAEREKLARALARDFAPLRVAQERLDLERKDIQAQLGPDDVLLDILRSQDRYFAWVIAAKGDAERLDLGEADAIEAAAREFAARSAERDDAFDEEAWLAAGKALATLVIDPIRSRLGPRVRTLIVCPDAGLAAVPFAALPGRKPKGTLLDDYLLVTVSMAQDLVPWADAGKPGRGAVLLGGVDYRSAAESAEGPGDYASSPGAGDTRAPRGGLFVALPGTALEVQSIADQLGTGSVLFLGSGATEAALRSHTPGTRILHLATHGFVRDDLLRGLRRRRGDDQWLGSSQERQLAAGHDPMNLAGLAMAGANPRDGGYGDDGILTALEASHLDLDGVDLVVLSACETALGRAESGEGVIGLVRGFQMAGTRRVVGSLWQVDDEATRALMVKFYELWSPAKGTRRLGAAAALRAAQHHVRSHEKWQSPHYWAGWALWGGAD